MPQPRNWSPNLSQPQPGSDAALALGWTWPAARQACDDHKRGTFELSWQLWTDMDSLPAIRAAKMRRQATLCGLPFEVLGPTRAPARMETEAARSLWKLHLRRLLRSTLSDVIGEGFSLWQHPTAVNPVTLRREVITVERWPISQVRYTPTPFPDVWQPGKWIERYYAVQYGVGDSLGAVMFGRQSPDVGRIEVPEAARLPGLNGVWVRFLQLPRPGETDGHWTFVADPVGADQPHLNGAVTALDVAYVGGAIMTRSMFNLSKTLGRQGIAAEMPEGTPPGGDADDDKTSQEGRTFRRAVAAFGTETAEIVHPKGAKVYAVELTAQSASLFPEFAQLNLQNVELAILGHAGTTAKPDPQYQAKDGVEVKVPQHLERADLRTITHAFDQFANVIAESNMTMPTRIFLEGHLPDTEQDEHRMAIGDRLIKAAEILKAEGEAGCSTTQARADQMGKLLDVPPALVAAVSPAPIQQWHVQQKVVAPDQALANLGLPPLPNGAGSVERLAQERLAGGDQAGALAKVAAAETKDTGKPEDVVETGGAKGPEPGAPAPHPSSVVPASPTTRALAELDAALGALR